MSDGGSIDTVGENKEFGVPTAGTEVTVYFTGGASADKTSADDTTTEKYTDSYGAVKSIQIRNDAAISIISYNGVDFTDPISLTANTGLIEKFDSAIVTKLTFVTTTANTNIKIRVRGR